LNAQESKIERVFYAALEKSSSAERAAYLDESCADDAELRGRVQCLLDAQPKVGRFLEHDGSSVDPTVGQPIGECLGTMIGRCKLLEEIGEGGMGAVYMAEQTEPIRRQVALKIIKLGMDTKQVVARFEAERQALAVMDHPNIAKVHDAGATDSGRPYFVMELIRGLPITEHCDQNNLTTKARIELFIDVCHAVQHAHLEGVIHRDIKPSNVIVTLIDGKPVPKVIDFGIAKATRKRLAEKTITTGDGQFLGTPQYMSPEQARMSDLHVDIRTDIYSLGVVLYELLVGRTPFDPKELRQAGHDEVYRIIRETDPPTPSKQLSTLGAAAEETSRQRQVQPKVLWKLLHGDLDCIVMKTLQKDRDDRYATADALADDLRRFLEDKPIEAKRPTPVERVAKWSRRHSWGVATSMTAAFGIVLAIAAMMWYGQRRESQQRTRAEENLRLALDAVDQVYLAFADHQISKQKQMTKESEKLLEKALTFYEGFAQANRGVVSVRRETAAAYARIGDIRSKLGRHHEALLALNKAI
jgi:serine/threonine protein kinase